MTTYYYDRSGIAIVHLHRDHLFLMNGQPIAFFRNNGVFNLRGQLLGYQEDGWIRDTNSCAVLYTDKHSGVGPLPSIPKVPPIPAVPAIPPVPPIPPIPPIPPVPSYNWSRLSATAFFNQ